MRRLAVALALLLCLPWLCAQETYIPETGGGGADSLASLEQVLGPFPFLGAPADNWCGSMNPFGAANACDQATSQIALSRDFIVTGMQLRHSANAVANCTVSICNNNAAQVGCGSALAAFVLDGNAPPYNYSATIADYTAPGSWLVDVSDTDVLVVHFEDAALCDTAAIDIMVTITGVFQ